MFVIKKKTLAITNAQRYSSPSIVTAYSSKQIPSSLSDEMRKAMREVCTREFGDFILNLFSQEESRLSCKHIQEKSTELSFAAL